MADFSLTPGTLLVLALLAGWFYLAVRRLFKKGSCDGKACSHGSCSCGGGCSSADKMMADVDAALAKEGR
ncbi:hypothetical protein JI75_07570 [Berryella intestinalis]|uniref:FeoB-associated Cys-rich membrane protein n=1 Tax=Berryella intestinalis TaxID=1531429 RepID=A0A0A8BBM7_9ACTN|nr:hypothetical protein [Berryella intestinalis]AJC12542.1 hypothetical protein JI75_07570 [Berryella intestinalis]